MRKLLMFSAAALAMATAPAMAEMATATTDLNLRAGPSSREPVIGMIAGGDSVNIDGCVNNGRWCKVSMANGEGWVSSRFLAGDFATTGVIVGESTGSIRPARPGSPGTTAGVLTGGTAGAITGAVIGGPPGAVIGGAAGMLAGGATGAALDPPYRVRTYIRSNRVEPVYIQGDYAVGTRLPRTVVLNEIPDYQYRYVYLNDRPVLVEPGSRRIVYVMR